MRNQITARGNWQHVCELARNLANSLENPVQELTYFATDSLGGREWVAAGDAKDTRPSHNGVYLGFSETQLESLKFFSATSTATISAEKKEDGSWEFRFIGTDVSQDGRESGYATTFENLGLKVLEKDLAFPEQWAKSAFWKYVPEASVC